jgi:hypothetical protein
MAKEYLLVWTRNGETGIVTTSSGGISSGRVVLTCRTRKEAAAIRDEYLRRYPETESVDIYTMER